MTEARTGIGEVLRLTGLLLAIALATSRFGLLGHELVGHGGTAVLVGGRVTDVQLFWFAGGWISYHFPSPPGTAALLAIAMGGVAIEALCGTALWTLVRGATLGRRLLRAIGATFVIHATWYFATGAWHGYGDGQLLYRELGSARFPVAIAAGTITCVCGFFAARQIVGPLVATAARPWMFVIAAVLAGGLHTALAVGEVKLRQDTTYAAVMQPERDRAVDHDLARWAAYERTRGGVTDAQRAAERARLERVHHTFPFVWLLAACAVLAILAGAWRSLAHIPERIPITNGLVTRATCCAAIAIAAVIAIDMITR
jgi:hypothetical protein